MDDAKRPAPDRSASVDDYVAACPEAVRGMLAELRAVIRKAIPDAEETIAYGMPTYKRNGESLVHFAAWKNHLSLYGATRDLVAEFRDELASYKIEKGTIQFPLAKPLPFELIRRILEFRARR